MPARMALANGTRLGSYEIIDLLGKGGMGEVYRARDTKLKRQVALKLLPTELASKPDRIARFQREAEVLASLNHPNIAQIHGFEESDGVQALVMEYVEGETLDHLISWRIPLPEAVRYPAQIADALAAAHGAGIVHRDLKPTNIIVTPDSRTRGRAAKLLDFGIARLNDPSPVDMLATTDTAAPVTLEGSIVGTAN
jgi:serine/threonine protein kinase